MSDADATPDEEPRDLDEPRAKDPRDVPVRFSALKMMARSAMHYAHAALYRTESTAPQRLGTAAHAATFGTPELAVFGPMEFEGKQYKGAKSGKAWEAFKAEHADKVIVLIAEARKAKAMAAAIRGDEQAAPLIFGPDLAGAGMLYEHEVQWDIPWVGGKTRRCAGRIDCLGPSWLVDLKALRDAQPSRFVNVGRWAAYHSQVVWYADGCAAAGLGNVEPMICVVENTAPYVVVTFRLSPNAIEDGRRMYMQWLEKLRRAEENNAWHGYTDGCIADFDMPDDSPFALDFTGSDDQPQYAA